MAKFSRMFSLTLLKNLVDLAKNKIAIAEGFSGSLKPEEGNEVDYGLSEEIEIGGHLSQEPGGDDWPIVGQTVGWCRASGSGRRSVDK